MTTIDQSALLVSDGTLRAVGLGNIYVLCGVHGAVNHVNGGVEARSMISYPIVPSFAV